MARRMQELNLDLADEELVARVVLDEVSVGECRHGLHPVGLRLMHMHGARICTHELGKTCNIVPEDVAANVVGVVVRHQRPLDAHVVCGGGRQNPRHIPGGIDNHAAPNVTIAHQIDEVGHLSCHRVLLGEVPAGLELSQIQSCHVPKLTGVRGTVPSMTPLHADDVLVSLAEGPPGLGQRWALTRLSCRHPTRPIGCLPAEEMEVFAALAQPDLVDQVIAGLSGDLGPHVVQWCGLVSFFGLMPQAPGAFIEALKAAVERVDDDRLLGLVLVLAQLGHADPGMLRRAAAVEDPGARWMLPIIVLAVADTVGAVDEAAREVAASIDEDGLAMTLGGLGVPAVDPAGWWANPVDAAAGGAMLAGAMPPRRAIRGSLKRRTQRWIRDLCGGVDGPSAALLRAWAARDLPEVPLWPVASAAWLQGFKALDPLEDVLRRGGGAAPMRLAAARQSVTLLDVDAVLDLLEQNSDSVGSVLGAALLPDPRVAASCVHAFLRGDSDPRRRGVAQSAAWSCGDLIPPLLRDARTRSDGLILAAYTPSEEVLEALLTMPVSAEPLDRLLYGRALACMGDQAILPRMQGLCALDGERMAGPRALAESLLAVDLD